MHRLSVLAAIAIACVPVPASAGVIEHYQSYAEASHDAIVRPGDARVPLSFNFSQDFGFIDGQTRSIVAATAVITFHFTPWIRQDSAGNSNVAAFFPGQSFTFDPYGSGTNTQIAVPGSFNNIPDFQFVLTDDKEGVLIADLTGDFTVSGEFFIDGIANLMEGRQYSSPTGEVYFRYADMRVSVDVFYVPEPATAALFGCATAAFGWLRRRRR